MKRFSEVWSIEARGSGMRDGWYRATNQRNAKREGKIRRQARDARRVSIPAWLSHVAAFLSQLSCLVSAGRYRKAAVPTTGPWSSSFFSLCHYFFHSWLRWVVTRALARVRKAERRRKSLVENERFPLSHRLCNAFSTGWTARENCVRTYVQDVNPFKSPEVSGDRNPSCVPILSHSTCFHDKIIK